MNLAKVDILLATYNGERYLKEQIESIRCQTFRDWRLLISDDCSQDNTLSIIQDYCKKDRRIILVSSRRSYGSPRANFFALLHYASAPFVAFCDQDDVWETTKLASFVQKMTSLQSNEESSVPLLVFSDLKVVGQDLGLIDRSYYRYMKLDPSRISVNQLAVQNEVTGCAMMLNRPLARMVLEMHIEKDNRIIMHDWAIALVAACLGHLSYIATPTMLYRQHGDNSVGASKFDVLHWAVKWHQNEASVEASIRQAQAIVVSLYSSLGSRLLSEQKANMQTLGNYAYITHYSRLCRLGILTKGGYWKANLSRRIGQILFMLALPKEKADE